jgi:DNA polymerase III alpha subunit
MGFTDAATTTTDTPLPERDRQTGDAEEPTEDEFIAYITEEADLDEQTVRDQAATFMDNIQFLSGTTSLYLVARDHGLSPAEAFGTKDYDQSLQITNLQQDMNDVVLEAKVTDRFLHNPDDEDWRFLKITLEDETGSIDVMLWNEQIDEYDTLATVGATIRISHGYTDTYNRKLQVKLGDRASIARLDI